MRCKQHEVVDIAVSAEPVEASPFHCELWGVFDGPGGEKLRIPGFYNGYNTWVVRFAPTAPGTWSYGIESDNLAEAKGVTGAVECIPNDNPTRKGVLHISCSHPLHFAYADGTHYFMLSYECNWLWALDLGRESTARTGAFARKLKDHAFSDVVMNVYAHDCGWAEGNTGANDYGPPAMYAWEGTNDAPDHGRMNLAFFAHYDRVMAILYQVGLQAHIYLKVYNKMVNWPERRSREEELYLRYVLARYQAYPNIVWSFSKESYHEPDKDYMYDCMRIVGELDAYHHLRTTHDDIHYAMRSPYADTIDFHTAQQHSDFYQSALADRCALRKPYLNEEYGYEHGPGGPDDCTYGVRQRPEECVKRAYQIAMAGGYAGYYYTYTAWDIIEPEHTPPGYGYFKIFSDFFQSIAWWAFEPAPDYCRTQSGAQCLRRGDEEFVFFLADGDSLRLFAFGDVDFTRFSGYWMDVLTGEKTPFDPGTVTRYGPAGGVFVIEKGTEAELAVLYIR